MGYTHYFNSPKKLGNKKEWEQFTKDCKKIFDYTQNELGIALADGMGTPETQPEITSKHIVFNGSEAQPVGVWTTSEKISIPWPSDVAGISEINEMPFGEKTDGNWFAGNLLKQRTAPISEETQLGSGTYETLYIEREGDGGFNFCKTAYRPYDLVVTAILIALKHHFPKVEVSSDGEQKDWIDGRILCFELLGYGMDEEIK